MPAGSPELTQARREEIMDACEKLYKTMGYKEVTLKEIGKVTSFTRTSIYNYFHSKEEIFLAIIEREYRLWITDLKQMLKENKTMTKEAFAVNLSKTVAKRELLLKILSMNLYDIETNSRYENMVSFKRAYGDALRTVTLCLETYFQDMKVSDIQNFLYVFFPFMYGIYPYTVVNDVQRSAMEDAGINYVFMSIYEITYSCVRRLLEIKESS